MNIIKSKQTTECKVCTATHLINSTRCPYCGYKINSDEENNARIRKLLNGKDKPKRKQGTITIY